MSTAKRIGVSVLEAGWVLGKTESQVRRLSTNGVLRYVRTPRWIDPRAFERFSTTTNANLRLWKPSCAEALPRPGR
jgi:hypothetical protein